MLYYGCFSLLLKLVWLNIYRKCRLYFFYCDGVVHEILTGHKFQWPQESLYCEHLTCSTVKLPIMSWGLIIARLGGFKAPQFATFNRSSWSELRYLNFEPSLKLWWRCPRDSYGLRIPVTPGGIEDFSKRFLFWNNITSSFCVCFIFNVGSALFQRWSTMLKQLWSDVEMLAGWDQCEVTYFENEKIYNF